MKQANLGRGIFILLISAFFGYRYFSLDSTIHLIYFVSFLLLGGVSMVGFLHSRWQNTIINIGVTLFFLDFVFAEIDLSEVYTALEQANHWMLIPAGVLVLIHLYFRAVRWQWLLKPMGEIGFWPAFRAMSIGLAGNIILPARAGEFMRAYVLGRSTGLAKTGVFATLVVERIFDGLTVLLLLVTVIIFGVRNEIIQTAGIVGSLIYLGIICGVIAFMVKRHWADAILHRVLPQNFAERAIDLLDGFSSGLDILKNPRQLIVVSLLSLATWVFIPLSFWTALWAFEFGVEIPWQTPTMMFSVIALGLTLPGTPGGLGVFQAGVKATLDLTTLGQPVVANFEEVVGAASILVHISQLIPQLIPGFLSFWVEGLSTSEINAGQELVEVEGSEAVANG